MFLARRPAPSTIAAFLRASADLPLSYEEPGLVDRRLAAGHHDEMTGVLQTDAAAFPRARMALATWRHFDLGWVELFPGSEVLAPGVVAAVLIRHCGFWSLNGCRVLTVDDEATRFAFTYGTLTNHAEAGEERFEVFVDPSDGRVWYRIRAVSRPRASLAHIGQPIVRLLQARFRRGSLEAMRRAVGVGPA